MPRIHLTLCEPTTLAHSLLCFAILLLACAIGCDGGHGPYPTPRVTTAVGSTGTCEFCQKPIEMVGDENMVTVGSSRFPVCDSTCGARLQEKFKDQ